MKKIALVLYEGLPVPAVMGGAIEELVTILIEQNEIEHKVEFYVFSMDHPEARERAKGYKYTHMIYLPKTSVADRIANRLIRYTDVFLHKIRPHKKTMIDIAYYRRVMRYLKAHPVDAIVCEGGKYEQFRRFSEEFGKEKLYLHVHHHLLCEDYFDHIFGNAIGISNFARDEFLRTTKEADIRGYTVYNSVNQDKFTKRITAEERREIRASLGFSQEDFVVIYCGRIIEVKGARELVQAIVNINDPHIKLLMIGSANFGTNEDTPYVKEVKELLAQAGERVQFTGYLPNTQLYRYYQSADLQVIPSLWEEAAGLIAIEGMLCGLPLVVTRSGGLIEYAPQDVACQVERAGIVENLEHAITELSADAGKRKEMSKKSSEQALKFPKSRFYREFIEVFEHEGIGKDKSTDH
jgi:spore coat protein SA